MSEMINKPVSMLYEEFRSGLTNLINTSGLPAYLIETILQNYLYEVNAIGIKEYQAEKEQFERRIANSQIQEGSDVE